MRTRTAQPYAARRSLSYSDCEGGVRPGGGIAAREQRRVANSAPVLLRRLRPPSRDAQRPRRIVDGLSAAGGCRAAELQQADE